MKFRNSKRISEKNHKSYHLLQNIGEAIEEIDRTAIFSRLRCSSKIIQGEQLAVILTLGDKNE